MIDDRCTDDTEKGVYIGAADESEYPKQKISTNGVRKHSILNNFSDRNRQKWSG